MTHSPEPWMYINNHYDDAIYNDNEKIADNEGRTDPANFERIVACINACAGIPSTALEKVIRIGLEELCCINDAGDRDCPEWIRKALGDNNHDINVTG